MESNKESERVLKSLTGSKKLIRNGAKGSLSGHPGPQKSSFCHL